MEFKTVCSSTEPAVFSDLWSSEYRARKDSVPVSAYWLWWGQVAQNLLVSKRFASVEEVKQKMAEALKGIKIDEFKNCFEQ